MRSFQWLFVPLLYSCSHTPVVPEGASGVTEKEVTAEASVEEMRGIWITRFSWTRETELRGMLDHASAVGFNAVFFQVRGSFDAYYSSDLEPWAARLTGQLGRDPGWDPLAMVVEHAHFLGMEVHAYMNTYPLWRGLEPPESEGVPHALTLHPDWVVTNGAGEAMALNEHYVFASPGNPEVQDHVFRVAQDIASRYDVDGIHLDYIRYPGREYSHDPVSLEAFAEAAPDVDWVQWQRAQPGALVERLSQELEVPLSAAVWGVYEDRFQWGRVSSGLHDYYQDSHGWVRERHIDAIAPMIYWSLKPTPGDRLDFSTLLEDHMVHSGGRHLYAGIGGEKLDMEQVIACIEETRRQGAAGIILFDYSLFAEDLDRLGNGVFAEPAIPPPMPWIESSDIGTRK